MDYRNKDLAELLLLARGDDEEADAAILARAGAGDIDAQRAIRDHLIDPSGMSAESLVAAIPMAEMIAARGGVHDGHRLGAALLLLALDIRDRGGDASTFAERAAAVFTKLADEGDWSANEGLAAVCASFPDAAPGAAAPVTEAAPPPLVVLNVIAPPADEGEAELPPSSLGERLGDWLREIGWDIRAIGWAFCDLGKTVFRLH